MNNHIQNAIQQIIIVGMLLVISISIAYAINKISRVEEKLNRIEQTILPKAQ